MTRCTKELRQGCRNGGRIRVCSCMSVHIPILRHVCRGELGDCTSVKCLAGALSAAARGPKLVCSKEDFLPICGNSLGITTRRVIVMDPFVEGDEISRFMGLLPPIVRGKIRIVIIAEPPRGFGRSSHGTIMRGVSALRGSKVAMGLGSSFRRGFAAVSGTAV